MSTQPQHGVDRLWPKIVKVFRELHDATLSGNGTSTTLCRRNDKTSPHLSSSSSSSIILPIRLFSIEEASILHLLESHSNYSAGSIQLAVLGKLLTSSGFTHWDLGTGFEYKDWVQSGLNGRNP
eukprot:scaffold5533_cov111-Skeletonema_dohrnii-CCMP3373.AAC.1